MVSARTRRSVLPCAEHTAAARASVPPWRPAIEAGRLLQARLATVTRGGLQPGHDGLRTMRLPLPARHPLPVKGREGLTDGLDGPPHPRRQGLRGQRAGTRQDEVGPPDTASVRGAAVGLHLETLISGQGSEK